MLERSVEAVKVVVRCRPMNQRERDLMSKNVVVTDNERCMVSLVSPGDPTVPPKTFTFDSVYGILSNSEQIYNEMVYPLVEGVLEGYNATIFAYGQTGCGKSFTMQGVKTPSQARGIIPRAFEHIFEAISLAENAKFLVIASYLEIYNEEIRDLLGEDIKRRLELKDNAQTGLYVQGLSKHPVQSVAECERLMELGWSNRATGATLMNADSSRSHSIFTIAVETLGNHGIRQGKLNLVDLAGSERQTKTGATGDRLKEATKINLSLMALGNVISALVDGKAKHIPYRDSKLTRLLQDSLGGNTKTLMIACINPTDSNYDETLSTLRYANRAKNITNKPRINEDPKDALLRQYQQEIEKLKALLQTEEGKRGDNKLRDDYENEMMRLRQECEREQSSKLQLQKDLETLQKDYEAKVKDRGKQSPQVEVFERLSQLQMSMVGGERAGDVELKEKRMRRKKASERRLEVVAKALATVSDDDGALLKVYDDIQEELRVKTEALRKYKNKVRGLEKEIADLQSEFETERTDYLDTIRRNERQIKLYEQIAEKMTQGLRKECNYCNLNKIKETSVWNEELEEWEVPEMTVSRTKLPPAGHTNSWAPIIEKLRKETSLNTGFGNWNNLSERRSDDMSSSNGNEQKFEEKNEEDLVGNYFKPRRVNQLLSKAREDATRTLNYVNRSKVSQNQTHGNLNALNLSAGSLKKDFLKTADSLNNSWSGSLSYPTKPNKLDALVKPKINTFDYI